MAGLLDLMKVFNNPGNQEMFTKLPQFLNEWISFMKFLRGRVDTIDSRLENIDKRLFLGPNDLDMLMAFRQAADLLPGMDFKLDRLLDPEPLITPEIHAAVMTMADDDPRQRNVTNGQRRAN